MVVHETVVNDLGRGFIHLKELGFRFVLGKIFDLDRLKDAKSNVQCDFRGFDAFQFHALENGPAKVHAGCRSSNSANPFGKNGLVAFLVFGLYLPSHFLGQRCFSKGGEGFAVTFVIAIENETNGPAAGGGIVHHFGD